MLRLLCAALSAALLVACSSDPDPNPPHTPDGSTPPCVPTTCEARGAHCGTVPDGCGGTLSCGTCQNGQSCGGGGTPNVCGEGACIPRSCEALGKNCGQVSDGCGETLECGTCLGGQTCGGGGSPNVCGESCTPKSCETLGRNCGEVSDGCGGTLSCGTCADGFTCGGGGTEGVCGKPCAACPAGFTCDGQGTCIEGNPLQLALDVQVLGVSGRVTHNGALPRTSEACTSGRIALRVHFKNQAGTPAFSLDVPCDSTDFSFAGRLSPGTYDVAVENVFHISTSPYGYAMELPRLSTPILVRKGLVLSADAELVLDVKSVPVGGQVLLNGVLPQKNAACDSDNEALLVSFTDKTSGGELSAWVPCTTSDFTFATHVVPGTYRVSVRHWERSFDEYGTDFPRTDTPYTVFEMLTIHEAMPSLTLDVLAVPVSGTLTLNGRLPQKKPDCTGSTSAVYVSFWEPAKQHSFLHVIPCSSSDFSFALTVYPGTYDVLVTNPSGLDDFRTDLPATDDSHPVLQRLPLTAPATGLALDVKAVRVTGQVLLNGEPPRKSASCTSGRDALWLWFYEEDTSDSVHVRIPCSASDFSFDTWLYPASYRVYVGNQDYSTGWATNLPTEGLLLVRSALPVTDGPLALPLDVRTVAVSGKLTQNGAVPVKGEACTTGRDAATLSFVGSGGVESKVSVPCSSPDFSFSATLVEGTYKVYVQNGRYTVSEPLGWTSGLPQTDSKLEVASVTLGSPTHNLVLDVPSAQLTGRLTVEGLAPRKSAACTSTRSAVTVDLHEKTRGLDFPVVVPCSATDFAFTRTLVPGTYVLTVRNTEHTGSPAGFATNLGHSAAPYPLRDGLAVTRGATLHETFDIDVVSVAGTVKLEGRLPQENAACTDARNAVRVTFTELAGGPASYVDIPCTTSTFAFVSVLYAGTYQVGVANMTHWSSPAGWTTNLPESSEPAIVTPRVRLQ